MKLLSSPQVRRFITVLCIVIAFAQKTMAAEGLWIPSDTAVYKLDECLAKAGSTLGYKDIYAEGSGSISNAIIHFNFGCSGGVLSDNGLAITNYHCLIKHVSLLPNADSLVLHGFSAESNEDEIILPGVTVEITRKIVDITDSISRLLDNIEHYSVRKFVSDTIFQNLERQISEKTGLNARIKPDLHLTRFHLYLTESFNDVRLVFFPPNYINFGKDADNWQWPRHSGDFAFVRIYQDGKPLQNNDFITIADTACAEHDFVMQLGFPTETSVHVSSSALQCLQKSVLPQRIESLRERSAHFETAILRNDSLSLKYASKNYSAQNYIVKFDGALTMLDRHRAYDSKLKYEFEMSEMSAGIQTTIHKLLIKENESCPFETQNSLLLNSVFGADLFLSTLKLRKLSAPTKDFSATQAVTFQQLRNFHTETDMRTEVAIAEDAFVYYIAHTPAQWLPESLKSLTDENSRRYFQQILKKSELTDAAKTERFIQKYKNTQSNKLDTDPLFKLTNDIYNQYLFVFQPLSTPIATEVDSLYYEYYSQLKRYDNSPKYPDANATLRVSYGLVSKTEPMDGVLWDWKTTKKGLTEKYNKDSVCYTLPKVFLQYINDVLPSSQTICFTTTSHTSGGMSGSPVVNQKGEMIGLNFDRTQQATMSDYYYSEETCRNIAVDIQYIMHLLDHYFNAQSLSQEIRRTKPSR